MMVLLQQHNVYSVLIIIMLRMVCVLYEYTQLINLNKIA